MNKRFQRSFLIVALATVICAPVCHAADENQKLSIPDAESQAATLKLVNEIYDDELKAARTNAEKSTLAIKMLSDAINTTDDQVGRYVLICEACERYHPLFSVKAPDRVWRSLLG